MSKIMNDMIVKVINHKDKDGKVCYRTCVGTIGTVIAIRPYTTKTNVVIRVTTLVDSNGATTDYSNKKNEDRDLELNICDVVPLKPENLVDVKVGQAFKIMMRKGIFIVTKVDGDTVSFTDYVSGATGTTHRFIIDKIVPTPKLGDEWVVKTSKTKTDMYLIAHKVYPFTRKYIQKENFTAHHHELFTWFKEKKAEFIKKETKPGQFVKTIQKKTYTYGKTVMTKEMTNVHTTEGWFAELLATKYVDTILNKRGEKFIPESQDHHIGIEVECITKLSHDKLAVLLGKHGLHKNVRLTTDGSIRNKTGYVGVEIRVLCKESDYASVLAKLNKALSDPSCDGQVNESCGCHVHFDMRNRKVEKVYENLCCMQRVVRSMIPEARRSNSYCHAPKSPFYHEQMNQADHYDAISLSAYKKQKTIEIRYLEGQVDNNVISNWIGMWIELINLEDIDRNYASVEKFKSDFPEFKHIGFMESRVKQFNK